MNRVLRYIRLVLLSSIIFANVIHTDAFIFDMGHVLINTDQFKLFLEIGIRDVGEYIIRFRQSPTHIKSKLYEILNKTEIRRHINPRKRNSIVKDHDGVILPDIMCFWLKGTISCYRIRHIVISTIEKHPEWFVHQVEQRLITNLATIIFTPEQFIRTRKLLEDGIEFVKECKRNGHETYLLSNWDPESFVVMQQQFPEFFELFNGIVISGQMHSLKPKKRMYKRLLKKYKLNPRNCWFIDDQKENIYAARKRKICGLHCPEQKTLFGAKPNFNTVRQQLAKAQQAKAHVYQFKLYS